MVFKNLPIDEIVFVYSMIYVHFVDIITTLKLNKALVIGKCQSNIFSFVSKTSTLKWGLTTFKRAIH